MSSKSNAAICIENGWTPGDTIGIVDDKSITEQHFKLTAIGEFYVLARRVGIGSRGHQVIPTREAEEVAMFDFSKAYKVK